MGKSVFIGIDIGSEQFAVTILSSGILVTSEFNNSLEGCENFYTWLEENNASEKESIVVMESTGVYCDLLCHYLYSKSYNLCVENALKVKRAFGISLPKNDRIDSKKIAEYAMRFNDQLKLWFPPDQILLQVQTLLSLREQFVTQNTSNKNILKALDRKVVQNNFAIEILESSIDELKEKIENIKKEITKLLLSNKEIGAKYLALISIPGVALLLAAELLVITNGFTKNVNNKEIASYLGICPHEYKSGKSVYRKPRSAGYGHPRIRKLIYLAACSVRQHNESFKNYFNRKVKEGKDERMLINNIANKLIKIICGVIKSGKSFIPNFKSLHPALEK